MTGPPTPYRWPLLQMVWVLWMFTTVVGGTWASSSSSSSWLRRRHLQQQQQQQQLQPQPPQQPQQTMWGGFQQPNDDDNDNDDDDALEELEEIENELEDAFQEEEETEEELDEVEKEKGELLAKEAAGEELDPEEQLQLEALNQEEIDLGVEELEVKEEIQDLDMKEEDIKQKLEMTEEDENEPTHVVEETLHEANDDDMGGEDHDHFEGGGNGFDFADEADDDSTRPGDDNFNTSGGGDAAAVDDDNFAVDEVDSNGDGDGDGDGANDDDIDENRVWTDDDTKDTDVLPIPDAGAFPHEDHTQEQIWPEEENEETDDFEPDERDPIVAEAEAAVEHVEEELAKKEKVARTAGGFGFVLAIGAMIFTAYQMSENPDGMFASICRLAITLTGMVVKIICMPCRKAIGVGHPHYTGHMPISTTSDYSYRPEFELS